MFLHQPFFIVHVITRCCLDAPTFDLFMTGCLLRLWSGKYCLFYCCFLKSSSIKHYLSAWAMKYKHDSDLASLLQSSKIRHPSEFMINHLIFPWNLYVHCLLLQLFPSRRGIADSLKYHHYLLSRFVRENWAQQLIKLPCACPTQSDISTHLEQQHWDTTGSKLKAIITCKCEHFDDTVSLSPTS